MRIESFNVENLADSSHRDVPLSVRIDLLRAQKSGCAN
jgi:hypothetical protein